MKIGVLGPVYISVQIDSNTEFDAMKSNTGLATMNYSGPYVEVAKYLSEEHNVTFISSLDTRAAVSIRKYLESFGIDTSNIGYESAGTAFRVRFNDDCEFKSTYFIDNAVARLQALVEASSDLDVLIISDLIPEVINICTEHNIRVVWLADQNEIDNADYDDDAELISKVKIVSTDSNMKEVLV